jgi:ferredoxin
MSWKIDRRRCLRCGACVSVCPEMALDLQEDGLFNNPKKCTSCGICMRVCPSRAIEVGKK